MNKLQELRSEIEKGCGITITYDKENGWRHCKRDKELCVRCLQMKQTLDKAIDIFKEMIAESFRNSNDEYDMRNELLQELNFDSPKEKPSIKSGTSSVDTQVQPTSDVIEKIGCYRCKTNQGEICVKCVLEQRAESFLSGREQTRKEIIEELYKEYKNSDNLQSAKAVLGDLIEKLERGE